MKTLKHIGKMKETGAKVVVVFRTLPGESNSALVLPVSKLGAEYHDSLMAVVESDQGQEAFELGEILFIRMFPDGKNMLTAASQGGYLQKVFTDKVIMTPTTTAEVSLDQLNVLIAEQKNCAVDDLCNFVKGSPLSTKSQETKIEEPIKETVSKTIAEPVTDKDLARSYRSQADAMYKEAAKLRKQADELDPPAKKASKSKETESA